MKVPLLSPTGKPTEEYMRRAQAVAEEIERASKRGLIKKPAVPSSTKLRLNLFLSLRMFDKEASGSFEHQGQTSREVAQDNDFDLVRIGILNQDSTANHAQENYLKSSHDFLILRFIQDYGHHGCASFSIMASL